MIGWFMNMSLSAHWCWEKFSALAVLERTSWEKWEKRGKGRERDDLPPRSKMSSGRNSAEQDDVPLSCLTPLNQLHMGRGHSLNKTRSFLLSHQWKRIPISCLQVGLVTGSNRSWDREVLRDRKLFQRWKKRWKQRREAKRMNAWWFTQRLWSDRGSRMCEGSYGRDDLLESLMRGTLLSMCLPGPVTFHFRLPSPNTCAAHPKWSWKRIESRCF